MIVDNNEDVICRTRRVGQMTSLKPYNMSLKVLTDDWSDYDQRKIRDRRDARYFAFTENWELDYLIRKYKKAHPYLTEAAIKTAISECCTKADIIRPREEFIQCVSERLGV